MEIVVHSATPAKRWSPFGQNEREGKYLPAFWLLATKKQSTSLTKSTSPKRCLGNGNGDGGPSRFAVLRLPPGYRKTSPSSPVHLRAYRLPTVGGSNIVPGLRRGLWAILDGVRFWFFPNASRGSRELCPFRTSPSKRLPGLPSSLLQNSKLKVLLPFSECLSDEPIHFTIGFRWL